MRQRRIGGGLSPECGPIVRLHRGALRPVGALRLAAALALPPLVLLAAPQPARAGLVACDGLRLEDFSLGDCELRVGARCEAGCARLGVYKKACATELHTVCRQDCSLTAEPSCADDCTESCAQDCERGINVLCADSCFSECVGGCDARCEGVTDEDQCRATCEATCDGECDVRCRPLADERCYTHCVECCGGSCMAQANLECQSSCQAQQFESCERRLQATCEASCDTEGALFCDGEYMVSGEGLPACVRELVERRTLEASAATQFQLNAGALDGLDGLDGLPEAPNSCSVGRTLGRAARPGSVWLLGLALAARCRRRRSARV